MKPFEYLPAVIVAFMLVPTRSEAHGPAYPVPQHAAAVHSAAFIPHWLRRDAAFRHWYSHSRYHYSRQRGWRHLYARYRIDQRHARHAHRRCHHAPRYRISYRYD